MKRKILANICWEQSGFVRAGETNNYTTFLFAVKIRQLSCAVTSHSGDNIYRRSHNDWSGGGQAVSGGRLWCLIGSRTLSVSATSSVWAGGGVMTHGVAGGAPGPPTPVCSLLSTTWHSDTLTLLDTQQCDNLSDISPHGQRSVLAICVVVMRDGVVS